MSWDEINRRIDARADTYLVELGLMAQKARREIFWMTEKYMNRARWDAYMQMRRTLRERVLGDARAANAVAKIARRLEETGRGPRPRRHI